MADERDTHIASDDDLLSRYALGRLNEAEREKVDRHTAGCSVCTEALRREMRIAAGSRRLGRDELKARLKRNLAAAPQGAAWPRILSVAAAAAIVTGLAVYYAWFSGGESLTPPLPVEAPPLAGRMKTPNEDKANASPREPADGAKGDRRAESPVPSVTGLQAKQKRLESPVQHENERMGIPAGEGAAPPGAAAGAPAAETAGEFWSEGVVETGDAGRDAAAPRGAVTPREKSGALFQSNAVKKADEHAKDALSRRQGEYLIRQQPSRTLPGERERSAGDQQRVPTRVEQRGSTTTMTMYLDSLLDEKDLMKAYVEKVRDDSVVVTLGGKKILYRFLPGQSAQQRQK